MKKVKQLWKYIFICFFLISGFAGIRGAFVLYNTLPQILGSFFMGMGFLAVGLYLMFPKQIHMAIEMIRVSKTDIILSPGEIVMCKASAKIVDIQEITTGYEGKGSGIGIAILPGISVGSGKFSSHAVRESVTKKIPAMLTLTNQKIVLFSKEKSFSCPIKSLAGYRQQGINQLVLQLEHTSVTLETNPNAIKKFIAGIQSNE